MFKIMVMVAAVAMGAMGVVYAVEQGNMKGIEVPELTQVEGTADAVLHPAIFPDFVKVAGSDNDACVDGLVSRNPLKVCDFPGHPACEKYTEDGVNGDGYAPLEGLIKEEFVIPEQYRKTAKVLVTWTVRILGETYDILYAPHLCNPFNGTRKYNFTKGTVLTKLYVDGNPKSKEFSMEIPQGGSGGGIQDPTATGHYLISPSDYPDKTLPAKLKLQVYWKNNTSMIVRSDKADRSMIINFMPVGGNPAKN